jgi:hypothetical protein
MVSYGLENLLVVMARQKVAKTIIQINQLDIEQKDFNYTMSLQELFD